MKKENYLNIIESFPNTKFCIQGKFSPPIFFTLQNLQTDFALSWILTDTIMLN